MNTNYRNYNEHLAICFLACDGKATILIEQIIMRFNDARKTYSHINENNNIN